MILPARPVLPGFHPDPSVCRANGAYYLATSSFEYAPGVPLFRSTDLTDWELVGHALHRPSQLPLVDAGPSDGVFAPTLRHHDGRFWLATTNFPHRYHVLVVSAEDIAGPWSDPVYVPAAAGIDPDLVWDEDGTCHLTWTAFPGETEPSRIVSAPVDLATGELLAPARELWQGTGGKFPEGPHLYHVDGWWYLVIAEGGTEKGHAATVARARTLDGPFEASPHNPLVTARGLQHPVQSTGHADLVQRPDGTWAVLYLGTRPAGASPSFHVMGRETFASEVVWEDGWPRLGAPIEPEGPAALHESLPPPPALPLSWVAAGRFPDEVLRTEGTDRVVTAEGPQRVFAGRRQEHRRLLCRAEVDASEGSGGLELRLDPRHAVTVEAGEGAVRAVLRIGPVCTVLAERPAGAVVTLELAVRDPELPSLFAREPDVVAVALVDEQGRREELAAVDGRYLSTEVATGFTGRLVGVSCSSGRLRLRSFSYTGAEADDALAELVAPRMCDR